MTKLLEKTAKQPIAQFIAIESVEDFQPTATDQSKDGIFTIEELPSVADTAPEQFAWSAEDPDIVVHFDNLSPEEQRRRTSILGYDSHGNELIAHAALSNVDILKAKINMTSSFNDAMDVYYRVQNTDPIRSINLLARIAQKYAAEVQKDQEAQEKIVMLAEKCAKEAERVVIGETDSATPEEGLHTLVTAADIALEHPEVEAEIIEKINKAVQVTHDSNGVLVNGHAAADPLLAEAISDAISDKNQISSTSSLTLSELVNQHVEIKLMDQQEQDLLDEISQKKAALSEIRAQREAAEAHLVQEVRSQKRPVGIHGLLSGLIKVGR